MKAVNLMILIALCTSPAFAKSKKDQIGLYPNGTPMTLHVTQVRSISPETRVGFSKSWETYAVDAYSTVSIGSWISGPQMGYVLYCVNKAPAVGKSYAAQDVYIAHDYSFLHLWPVEKRSIGLKEKGRLYRVVRINNVNPAPYPDLACDVYSAKDLQPSAAQ